MPTTPRTAGKRLRALRNDLGLTLSEVEHLTRELAAVRRNPRLRVPKSRLCEIEAAKRTPSIHCFFALAQVYGCDVRRLMGFYRLT